MYPCGDYDTSTDTLYVSWEDINQRVVLSAVPKHQNTKAAGNIRLPHIKLHVFILASM